jgi:hypothetical protein
MPVRRHVVAIILFWLGAMGWLFYREVRPRLWPNEPPRLTFTLEDEAQRAKAPQQWELIWNGVDVGYTESRVDYDDRDDTFALRSTIKLWKQDRSVGGQPEVVIELMYRVTRASELREVAATATAKGNLARAEIHGPVRGGLFRPHIRTRVPKNPFIKDLDEDLQPIRVAASGYVLDPWEPMNRLPDLQPNQHWEMPLSTPVDDIMSGVGRQLLKRIAGLSLLERFLSGGNEFPWVEARVLPDTQMLAWPKQMPARRVDRPAGPAAASDLPRVECRVVEYHGESHGMAVEGRTWVRLTDGAVLQQEVTTGNLRLTLERELRLPPERDLSGAKRRWGLEDGAGGR